MKPRTTLRVWKMLALQNGGQVHFCSSSFSFVNYVRMLNARGLH